MDEDFPWFLLAMVIIAFLRWVALKLQGKETEPEVEVDERELFEENPFEEVHESEPPLARADPTVDPNEEIRRFIEAIGGPAAAGVEPVSKPPPPIPSPPPLPRKRDEPRKPVLSKAERAALEAIRSGRKAAEAAYASGARVRRPERSFSELLGTAEGLRTAVVLREVLGAPKGLKEFDDSPSV